MALSALASEDDVRPIRTHRTRAGRAVRSAGGWLLLAGWVALPLLPVLGLGLTSLLGVTLF